ncbi:MAG TPA: hypothetical protein VGA20_08225 [Gemmatimonadales bacterium]
MRGWKTTRWLGAILISIAACGDGTGPATSRNNPGTGTSTLQVSADIDANDDAAAVGGFVTVYDVSVRNGLGDPVSAATVTISNPSLGTLTLPETAPASGDYLITGNGFPSGDFTLSVVRGTDNVRDVVLGGPGVQNISAPLATSTAMAGQPLPVRWSVPSRAQAAEVETRDFGPITLPDTGAYNVPGASNPVRADQRVRVFRYNEVSMAGGLPGSRLRVKVRKTAEPVNVQ